MARLAYILLCIYVFLIPSQSLLYYADTKTYYIHFVAYSALLCLILDEFLKTKSFNIFVSNKILKKFFVIFSGFIVWAALSYFWSFDRNLSLIILVNLGRILILVILITKLISSQNKIFKIFEYYVLGGYIAIGSTFVQFLQFRSIEFAPYRYSAIGVDPNDLGVTLSLAIPVAWYFASTHKKSLMRLIFLFYIPLTILTVFLTGSRGALVTLTLSLIVVPFTYFKANPKSKIFFLGAILVAIYSSSLFLPQKTIDRFSSVPEDVRRSDLSKRKQIWSGGLEVFTENSIYGVGAGAYRTALYSVNGMEKVGHNAFLSVLVELGLIGIAIFGCVILFLINSIKKMKGDYRIIYGILLLAWIAGASSLSWDYYLQTWFIFVLIVVQASLFHKEKYYEPEIPENKQLDIVSKNNSSYTGPV